MVDRTDPEAVQEQWTEMLSQMNEQFATAVEANRRAQEGFIESWADAMESVTDGEYISDAMEGYSRAYSVWMDAAEEAMEEATDAADGETDPSDFRDLWLDAANEAFKEVMSTDAFAAATGETVNSAAELRKASDEAKQASLHELGFAAERDIREVGERLVELERRQHEVERKLDRVLEHLGED
jgi:hypothetical protein